MKKVAILTSGGDSQGMNSAVRAITRTAIVNGYEVVGIRRGYLGLMEKDFIPLGLRDVGNILHRGGTFLLSARSEEFKTEAGQLKAIKHLNGEGINYLVVIGGDGSYHGAFELAKKGIYTYGLPGTIDNDIALTDYTIGFDTALNIVIEAVNKLRDTIASHQRVSVVEVMGRNCGDIALQAGLACGADAVLIPEIEWNMDDVVSIVRDCFNRDKKHAIIVLAEGVGKAEDITNMLQERTGIETRGTVLGHIQRGGSPTAFDRILSSRMGDKVIQLMNEGIYGVAVGIERNEITHHPFEEVFNTKNKINKDLYKIVRSIAR